MKSNEIKIIRLYDAPLKMVWEAFTDIQQVSQWWGPRGFSLTTHSKDLKAGGHWDYTMHGPNGVDYSNKTKYLEVEKYSRLVYDHGASAEKPPLFRVTALFSEYKNQTKLDLSMQLPNAQVAEQTKAFIKKAGGDATWDRLAEFLGKKCFNKDLFVINRSFNAPINQIFEMWTNPKHFSEWLAPTGFNMSFLRADIKVGGSTFYQMKNEQGMKMYGKAQYLEISKPNRVVYTQQFCDQNEKISRHPLAPVWPETMLTTATFSEEGPKQTRITIVWETHGPTTAEELNFFIQARTGMTQGWTGSFDKLEHYLEISS